MTAARELSDGELVAAWRVIVEGVTRTQAQIVRDLSGLELPVASFDALHRLLEAREHRLPMSTLARELSMTSGGFTKVADRMARAGLIDRRGTAGDRRVVNATLTEAGEALARRALSTYRSSLRTNILQVLSAPQFIRLTELAGILRETHVAVTMAEVPEVVVQPRDASLPDRRADRPAASVDRRTAGPAAPVDRRRRP